MPRESTIQILRSTSTDTPTGLTFGELAYSDVNGKLFVGRTGGTSLWVGAGITTGSISTNSATLVPTQSAVKTYVDGVVGGGSVVNSVNGTAGAISITGDGGSQLVTVSGTTTTLSNRLASATVTGVASFGNEFVVTSGAVGLTSNYVKSINGSTGAVTNIAKTNVDNNFSASQTVGGTIASNDGDQNTIYLRAANTDIFLNTPTIGANQRLVFTTSGSNSVINLPGASGTVALVGTTVASVNGATGAITITGAGAITYTQSGTSNIINARLASTSLTGVASFNSTRFTVSGAGAVDLAAAFQVTGDTVVAGNAITATRSGNSVTVDNNGVRSFNGTTGAVSFAVPLASASVTGVASFGNEFVVTSGAVGLTSNYVKSVNGLTGAVVSIATTGSNTFTGLNTFNAGISVASGATFSGDIAVNGGDITTTSATATVFNTTATNLSIGSAATVLVMGATSGGYAEIRNPTLRLGNTTSNITTINGYLQLSTQSLDLEGGSLPAIKIDAVDNAQGFVNIEGGNLRLGNKTDQMGAVEAVNLVFEGASANAFDTTLTVVDPTANRTLTLPDASGTIALTNTTVASFNGSTGAVSFAVPLASASVTGVASFGNEFVVTSGAVGLTSNYVRSVNGLTGAVVSIATTGSNTFTGLQTMNAGLTANHLYVTNGATFASRIQGVGATFTGIVEIDTGLILPNGQNITSAVTTFNGASGAVSFAVPLASASVTGVASFGNEFVVTSGAVGLTSNYTKSINGATGAITITGAGAITYTQSGTSNTINARLASTSVTGVAYFDSTNFTAAGDGKVSITNGTITNAQLANSSISFASGGSPSTVSLGGTLTITGTANEVKITNSGSGTITFGLPTDVVIGGNLTVNGTVITANVENFVVEDPLIALGTGNAGDSVDLGWYGMYTSGSLRYAGTFRDASDGGKFKFFGGLTAQPSAIIDTSAATYATATIVANIDGGTF